jgi:hypothetical protein
MLYDSVLLSCQYFEKSINKFAEQECLLLFIVALHDQCQAQW